MLGILDAPGQLPDGIHYYLLRDEGMLEDAAFLLACAPHGRFLGLVEEKNIGALGSDAHVVICSPHWAELTERLETKVPHLWVLLDPAQDVWGYSYFVRSLDGWPGTRGQVTKHAAHAHLKRFGKLVLDGEERFTNIDRDTLAFFQTQAAAHLGELAQVRSQLGDEISRDVLDALMLMDVEALFDRYLKRLFSTVQYFECNLLFDDMVIVNCGVQEGFELPYYMAHTRGTARIVSIDPGGFGRLSTFARPTAEHFCDKMRVVPRAVWNESGEVALPITEAGAVLSQFAGRNHKFREVVMPCSTIDEIVESEQLEAVDLVKMDIEGAEPEALQGMKKTLQRHRPQLAISVYHWPEHMWTIPLQLFAELEDYDFYLRHYSYGRWECILYAVPKRGTTPRLDRAHPDRNIAVPSPIRL